MNIETRVCELPFLPGESAYALTKYGGKLKVKYIYVEEIHVAIHRNENRQAEAGTFDYKIKPRRGKALSMDDVFSSYEQAEQALKQRRAET